MNFTGAASSAFTQTSNIQVSPDLSTSIQTQPNAPRLVPQARRGPGHYNRPALEKQHTSRAGRAILPAALATLPASLEGPSSEEVVPLKRPASALSAASVTSAGSGSPTAGDGINGGAYDDIATPASTIASHDNNQEVHTIAKGERPFLSASAPPSVSPTALTESILPTNKAALLVNVEASIPSQRTTHRAPFRPARPAVSANAASSSHVSSSAVATAARRVPPHPRAIVRSISASTPTNTSLKDSMAQARAAASSTVLPIHSKDLTSSAAQIAPPAKRQALPAFASGSSRPHAILSARAATNQTAMKNKPAVSKGGGGSSIFSRLAAPTASSAARSRPLSTHSSSKRVEMKKKQDNAKSVASSRSASDSSLSIAKKDSADTQKAAKTLGVVEKEKGDGIQEMSYQQLDDQEKPPDHLRQSTLEQAVVVPLPGSPVATDVVIQIPDNEDLEPPVIARLTESHPNSGSEEGEETNNKSIEVPAVDEFLEVAKELPALSESPNKTQITVSVNVDCSTAQSELEKHTEAAEDITIQPLDMLEALSAIQRPEKYASLHDYRQAS